MLCSGSLLGRGRGSVVVNTFHFLTPNPDTCVQDFDFDFSDVVGNFNKTLFFFSKNISDV